MKCKLINSSAGDGAPGRLVVAGFLSLAACAFFARPMAGTSAASEHEHGTNLAVYAEWRTNRLRLHYYVAGSKTYILQYLPVASPNNHGDGLLNAPWVNLPGTQAPRLPSGYDYEMSDYSVTNHNPTNLGRIYRLKVT
jgi:hypothetical protein